MNSDFDVRMLWKEPTPYMIERGKQFENRDWLASNLDEIWQKHKGKVVAVYDQEIKAVANNTDVIWDQLGDRYPKEGVMVVLVPKEPIFNVPYPSDMM
jgi:hypothetical protein